MKSLAIASVLAVTQISPTSADTPCDPADPAFVCNLPNAEDLFRLPGQPWVITSSINFSFTVSPPQNAGVGPVMAVRIDTRKVQRLYPTPESAANWDRATYPDCSAPPKIFGSAGINVEPLGKEHYRLFVANQSERHTVEVLDIAVQGERLSATWRGCILAPDYIRPNSVVPLPGGAVALSGGKVAVWRPGKGWKKTEAYTGTSANGIEASRDGKWLYIADPGERRVVRVAVIGEPGSTVIPVESGPDNLRWGEDGHLYGTDATARPPGSTIAPEKWRKESLACMTKPVCAERPFLVTQIDTSTLSAKTLFRKELKGVFGAVSTALQMGDHVWLGTIRGDRVAILPLRAKQ